MYFFEVQLHLLDLAKLVFLLPPLVNHGFVDLELSRGAHVRHTAL